MRAQSCSFALTGKFMNYNTFNMMIKNINIIRLFSLLIIVLLLNGCLSSSNLHDRKKYYEDYIKKNSNNSTKIEGEFTFKS